MPEIMTITSASTLTKKSAAGAISRNFHGTSKQCLVEEVKVFSISAGTAPNTWKVSYELPKKNQRSRVQIPGFC